jgi:hypothetical protein
LISIPPEVQIRSTIKSGSVYYFEEPSFSSSEPHYFIVLNHFPHKDEIILLAHSSSRIEKVKYRRRDLPPETLVEIGSPDYSCFTVDSIVDCNVIIVKQIEELSRRLALGKLKLKTEIDQHIVEKLRLGVLASPLVDEELKRLLVDPT